MNTPEFPTVGMTLEELKRMRNSMQPNSYPWRAINELLFIKITLQELQEKLVKLAKSCE